MAVKRYKPTSPARRLMTVPAYGEIAKAKPERALLEDQRKSGGRNNAGKITVRHIGGGNKRKYRIIDYKRNKDGIPAKVASIQYDPNRSAYIALLVYADGEKRYILAPVGLNVGDKVMSWKCAPEEGEYGDFFCNFESYTNEHILEVEWLSRKVTLKNGESHTMTEVWRVQELAELPEVAAALALA